jgi:sigma-54 dependent transcriptional regulator, acetoin dehydrogenase operon transcriptional activator AcoR
MMVNAKQVHRARTELLETGAVSEPLSRAVRPEILASWRRSAAFGAQPNVTSLPYQEDLAAAGRLVDAAEPVLRSLAASLAGLSAGVLLADRDANIVQRWVADSSILSALDRICSNAGFGAAEDSVGTNGIGTVAELGRAQMVVGPEHFADALVSFACIGAPIHNPTTRRLEGIVTLSCEAEAGNPLLTPLMVSTAAAIEHRLLMSSTLDERRVLDAYLAAKRHHHLVAAIGKDLLIAGAKATRLLDQLVDRDILWDVVAQVGTSCVPTRLEVPTSSHGEVGLVCTAIHDDGRLIGALVDLHGALHKPNGHTGRRAVRDVHRLQLPGENSRWTAALDAAARLAGERTPVVLVGAQGVGKWSIVREMTGPDRDAVTTLTIDCADIDGLRPLAQQLPPVRSPTLLLVRHLDALDDPTLRELGAFIDEVRSACAPWIVATLRGADGTISTEQQRLIDRFGGIVLPIPDLHDRPDDIPAIIRDLLARHPRGRLVHMSADAISELCRASWPGNIRQLDDVIRSVVASRVGEISVTDLPVGVRARSVRRSLSTIEQLECEAIIQALSRANGNKLVAARSIGLSRSTIYRKIRAYGLDLDAAFF